MVAPTWRIAVMTAEPEPLRSADRALSAAFIAAGMAIPSPRPVTANQVAAYPVLLCTLVSAPIARAAAISPNPDMTKIFALTLGSPPGWPSAPRGRPPERVATHQAAHHPADHRQQPHTAGERIQPADVLEIQGHREQQAEQRERHQGCQYRAPGKAGGAEQREVHQRLAA